MVSRKQELVLLDGRFIGWLSSRNAEDDDLDKRFIVIVEGECGERDANIYSYDSIDEVEELVGVTATHGENHEVAAIFDTTTKKEINFKVDIKVDIDFP